MEHVRAVREGKYGRYQDQSEGSKKYIERVQALHDALGEHTCGDLK